MNKTDAAEILQKYVFDDEECIAQDMKDYNEALKMAIEALSEPINCVKCKHYYETEDDTDVHGYCRMDTAHTDLIGRADAVEVVRCKDCRHRVHDEERGLYYCKMYYGQGDVSDENFCQWGERRK